MEETIKEINAYPPEDEGVQPDMSSEAAVNEGAGVEDIDPVSVGEHPESNTHDIAEGVSRPDSSTAANSDQHDSLSPFSFIKTEEGGISVNKPYIKINPDFEDEPSNRRYLSEEEAKDPVGSLIKQDENGKWYIIKDLEKVKGGLHEIGNRRYLDEDELKTFHEFVNHEDEGEIPIDSKPDNPDSIADIVKVDSLGRGHHTDAGKNSKYKNGQFLSNYEMTQIEGHQDLIRENIPLKAPETPPDVPPVEGGPGGPDGPEGPHIPEVLHEDWPETLAVQEAQEALTAASERMGHAKQRLERVLAGHDARELFDLAGEELTHAYERYIQANAELYVREDKRLTDLKAFNQQEQDDLQTRLVELTTKRATEGEDYDGHLDDEIHRLAESVAFHHEYEALIDQVMEQRTAERTAAQIQDIASINIMVDQALIRQREAAHPRLHRVNEWLNRRLHFERPRNRMIAGAAMTAMGVIGTVTLNPVLVGTATAGSAALRGYGSYQFARGVGERVASRRLNMDEIRTIEEYIDASRGQSDARRTSKRIGSAVAAALIVAPIVGKMLATSTTPQHVTSVSPQTPPTTSGQTITTPIAPTVTPIDGNTLPWNYGMNVLHTNIANPEVFSQLVHNSLGITFEGNGLGNGMGQILNVSYGGQTFTDLAHINGAIQAILGQGAA